MKCLIGFLVTGLVASAQAAPCTLDPFCPVETVDKQFEYEGKTYSFVTISQQMKADGDNRVLNQALLVNQNGLFDWIRIPLDVRQNEQFDANLRTTGGYHVNRYSILGTEANPRAVIGWLSRYTNRAFQDTVVLLITLQKDMGSLKPRVLLTEAIAKKLYTQLCHKSFPRSNQTVVLSEMWDSDVDYGTRRGFSLTVPGTLGFEFEYNLTTDEFAATRCPPR